MRGSKREKKPGVWELRVHLGYDPITGRRHDKSRTFRGTARQADAALARLITDTADGKITITRGSFAELVEQTLTLAEGRLSPTTLKGYRMNARLYLLPELGPLPVEKVTAAHLDRLYGRLAREGKAPGTIRQVHALARRTLAQAVRWDMIPTNPAERADPPPVRPKEMPAPDLPAMARVIDAATADDPDFGALLWVLAALGARRGEVCALRWADIDTDTAEVAIRRAVVKDADRHLVVKDTKTHQARRLAVDPDTMAVLAAQHERAVERARWAGVRLHRTAFVFSPEPDGSVPLDPDRVSDWWKRLRARHQAKHVRLHDLRHYHASVLLAAGQPIEVVSRRLGHGVTSTTLNIYSHAMPGSDRAAADAWRTAINRGKPPSTRAPRRRSQR